MTLVQVASVHAAQEAPTVTSTDTGTKDSRPAENVYPPQDKTDTTAMTDAPPVPKTIEEPSVYLYQQNISPRLGPSISIDQFSQDHIFDYFIGFTYSFLRQEHIQYEVGAELISRLFGGRLMARRKNSWFADKAFRPYYTLGAAVLTIPEDNVMFFARLKNYEFISSIGLEGTLSERMSWVTELEVGFGTYYKTMQLVLGYSYAW